MCVWKFHFHLSFSSWVRWKIFGNEKNFLYSKRKFFWVTIIWFWYPTTTINDEQDHFNFPWQFSVKKKVVKGFQRWNHVFRQWNESFYDNKKENRFDLIWYVCHWELRLTFMNQQRCDADNFCVCYSPQLNLLMFPF